MILVFQMLNYFQGLSSFLNIGISTIKLIYFLLSIQYKHIIMIQRWASKRNLQNKIWGHNSLTPSTWTTNITLTQKNFITCLILATRFPLQIYSRVSNFCSSGFLNPEVKPPSRGIMHGLKYDKNLSDSNPWSSLCWTARPPRTASSSTVLIAAVPASSWNYS